MLTMRWLDGPRVHSGTRWTTGGSWNGKTLAVPSVKTYRLISSLA